MATGSHLVMLFEIGEWPDPSACPVVTSSVARARGHAARMGLAMAGCEESEICCFLCWWGSFRRTISICGAFTVRQEKD